MWVSDRREWGKEGRISDGPSAGLGGGGWFGGQGLSLSCRAAEQLGQAGGRGLSCHPQYPLSQDKQEFSGLW